MHALFCGAFPDLQITVGHIFSSDNDVAGHFTCQATHTGDLLGIPATNQPVHFSGITLGRYRDGKIIEAWNCIDFLAMLQQIGKVPAMKDIKVVTPAGGAVLSFYEDLTLSL